MAFLNVRERRVETTIAYIGPFGAGKATNLEQLGRHAGARGVEAQRAASDELGETIALDWHPPSALQFRDCGLSVRVVASQGPPTAPQLRALLRAADGVVLVLDAHPSARDANRASAELVRALIEPERRTTLPVLVQVNKVDLAEARAAAEVAAELGAEWPHVEAAASAGDGVVETLERALRDVLTSLESAGSDPERETMRPPAGTPPARVEGNPLLAALRQVLRDTVVEHVAELERRFVAQTLSAIEGRFAAETIAAIEARTPARGSDHEALAELRRQLEESRAEMLGVVAELRGELEQSRRETRGELAELRAELAPLPELSARVVARVDELGGALTRSKEQLKVDVLSALDARSRSDRDLAAASLLPLRKSIDALGAELKSLELRDGLVEIGRDLGALRGQVEPIGKIAITLRELGENLGREAAARRTQLEPLAVAVQKLDALDVAVRRELGEAVSARIARVELALAEHGADVQEAHTRADDAVAELRNQITELLDELKKRAKKGWFG